MSVIIYQADQECAEVELDIVDGEIFLSKQEISLIFDITEAEVSSLLEDLFAEKELEDKDTDSTKTKFNLNAIIAIGYRVRSPKGTQFRRWMRSVLTEYMVKGFAMDDKRLKHEEKWGYFEEWLARIEDIRTSRKRFYQKIKDIYATAVDYNPTSEQTQLFLKKVQNKMYWAMTGKTRAELIAWQGSIEVGGKHLHQDDINHLNQIVDMYLDYAEERAVRRRTINMAEWSRKLEVFLTYNEIDLLEDIEDLKIQIANNLKSL